jgi:uncharacterized protein
VATPRFLADEMVGRLARYLRMMGADTTCARGRSDDEIVRDAAAEGRIVVTRDRELAHRSGRALLLTSPRIDDQVRAVWAAVPELARELRFDRCTLCNGGLVVDPISEPNSESDGVPWDRVRAGLALYRCPDCGHRFWEGSHTSEVRRRLRAWSEGPAP